MKLLRIQKKSLSESIAQQLRRSIFAGQPMPGEKLPPERELAESLGTNRNTLREAIRSLESLGLVSVRQGDGVRVASFREEAQLNLLPLFLLENPQPLEAISMLEDLLFLRRSLLAMAARRVAEQGNAAVQAELRGLAELQKTQNRPREAMLRTDLEFFACLLRGTGSLVMRWLFNSVAPVYDQALESFPELWMVPEGYLEFLDKIVNAVEAARAEEAAEAILRYFETVDPVILELARHLASERPESLGALLDLEF